MPDIKTLLSNADDAAASAVVDSAPSAVGIIGGSILMELPAFRDFQQVELSTPHGKVLVYCGKWNNNLRVVFCQRHQSDPNSAYAHPRDIPFAAIAAAMKSLSCDFVLGVYSVGSLKEGISVGSLVIPHDFWNPFDVKTMTPGPKAHVLPCIHHALRKKIMQVLSEKNIEYQDGSVYVQSFGPRFETKSEIKFFSMFGDVVGMTGAHECELVVENRIPFSMISMVVNYANGIQGEMKIDEIQEEQRNNKNGLLDALSAVLNHFSSLSDSQPRAGGRELVDTIIYAKKIVPVEPMDVVYHDHALVVHEGKIEAILPWDQAAQKYVSHNVVDRKEHALMPGLINAHTHASMNLLRGLADDKPLCDWLAEDIWPAERKFVDPQFVQDGTHHACAEMLRGGTTCFNDMYFFPEHVVSEIESIGMRAVLGNVILEFPSQYASGPDEYLSKGVQAREQFKNSKLIRWTISPHAPYTVSDDTFQRINEMSSAENIPIQLHLHETHAECHDSEHLVDGSMSKHQSSQALRPLPNLHRLNVLSKRLIAVHMTQLTDDEIRTVAETQTNVVHCPTSNLKLASGICRTTDLLTAGVNVALGTDGSSSNNTLDMWFEMKLAAILAKAESKQCTSVPAAMALRMATLNGAIALGLDKDIGSLQVGKCADVVAVSLNSVEMMPMYCIISHLVYVAGRENVSDVWVNGKQLMKHRQLQTIDTNALSKRVLNWHDKISAYHEELARNKK